jgi:hypothetical protein
MMVLLRPHFATSSGDNMPSLALVRDSSDAEAQCIEGKLGIDVGFVLSDFEVRFVLLVDYAFVLFVNGAGLGPLVF